jgi:glutathione S-transferase
MKLYDDPRAPNPRRVRMFLAEKGLAVDRIQVSIAGKENLDPSYLQKNPLGLLPALELDDGRIICESMAICRYLEETASGPLLFGRDPIERALVEQWSRHAELEVLFPIANTFQNTSPFWEGRREQVPAFGEVARKQAMNRIAWFDTLLEGRDFLVGDSLTVADITLYCAVDFGRVVKVRVDDSMPNLMRYMKAIGARASASA